MLATIQVIKKNPKVKTFRIVILPFVLCVLNLVLCVLNFVLCA